MSSPAAAEALTREFPGVKEMPPYLLDVPIRAVAEHAHIPETVLDRLDEILLTVRE